MIPQLKLLMARTRELNGFVDGLAEAGVPDELIDITLDALEGGDLEILGPLLLAGGLDDDLEEVKELLMGLEAQQVISRPRCYD